MYVLVESGASRSNICPTAGSRTTTLRLMDEEGRFHDEVRFSWDTLAAFWDERMEAGSTWQRHLIYPSVERLLELEPGRAGPRDRVRQRRVRSPDGGARRAGTGGRLQRGDARAGSSARRGRRVPARWTRPTRTPCSRSASQSRSMLSSATWRSWTWSRSSRWWRRPRGS